MDVYHSMGKGPVQLMQGNAGGMQAEKFCHPAPEWSAFRMANGYIIPNNTRKADVASDASSGLQALAPLEQEALGREHRLDFRDKDHPRLDKLTENWEYANTFGFGVIEAVNATHLHYHTVPVMGDIGADEFWIVKER